MTIESAKLRLTWYGDVIKLRVGDAAKRGVDDTMAAAALSAKGNHPGWRNITTTAEGSVTIITPAHDVPGAVRGVWGSRGVNYVVWLELKHGAFLRNAAGQHYPSLGHRIAQHMGGGLR